MVIDILNSKISYCRKSNAKLFHSDQFTNLHGDNSRSVFEIIKIPDEIKTKVWYLILLSQEFSLPAYQILELKFGYSKF